MLVEKSIINNTLSNDKIEDTIVTNTMSVHEHKKMMGVWSESRIKL